ncbi:hypothetical protein ACMGGR_16920 [Erwinia sp. BNK-24-b]|uniref:hypothetical protein n=1 Tax=unclassified Erwinia TaxID=2622719 RepID=UPI0039BEED15
MAGINSLPSTVRQATSSEPSAQASSSHGPRARHTTAGPSGSTVATADAARQQAISDIATHLNNYFPGSSGMNDIVQDRAAELHSMGETPETIAANMAKAQKMDYISDAVGGAVKAFPFAISGYASGALKLGAGVSGTSPGSEALAGAIDGATAMVLKSVGDKVFANVVKDTMWLAADAEKLEPEMQEALKKRQGLGESLKLAPLGGLGFDGRNAVVGTVATVSHNNPQAVSHTSNVLSMAAGAAGNVLTNKFSASHGPEYLLGRTDWKAQYESLKNTSVKQQMTSGGAERLKTLLLSLMTPRNYAKGALNITSGNMVSEIGALAVALAGNNALRNIVRNPGVSEAVTSASSAAIDAATGRIGAGELTSPKEIAKDQAVNLVGAALAYAFQGVAGALAGPAPTRNDEAVDFLADKVVNSLAGQKTGELRDKSVELLQQGVTGAGHKAVQAKDLMAQGAHSLADSAVRTGDRLDDGLRRMKNNVSDTATSVHQWAGEQIRRQFAPQPQPAAPIPLQAVTHGGQASTPAPAAMPAAHIAQASTSAPAAQTAQASTSAPAARPTMQPAQASTSTPAARPTTRPTPASTSASAARAAAQTAQASTSTPAARPTTRPTPASTSASAARAAAQTAQSSTSTPAARPTPQPVQAETSTPAARVAAQTAQASTSAPAARPAPQSAAARPQSVTENIEMQPLGKSKQA